MACYLLRAGQTVFVKIGYAIDVAERVTSLQTAHWEKLILLRTWSGDKVTEGWLHRQFAHHRIEREWFTFDAAMLQIEPPDLSMLRKGPSADPDPILLSIEDFLLANDMTATAFGKRAAADPMLVHDIRLGREVRKATRLRIQTFLSAAAA